MTRSPTMPSEPPPPPAQTQTPPPPPAPPPAAPARLRRIFLALALTYLAGELLVVLLPVRPFATQTEILTEHQVERARALAGGEVVLLGDSSLGNAVDADLLSELSGERCVNLALVALFGTRSDALMAGELLAPGRLPRAVVLMHSPANWSQPGEGAATAHLADLVDPGALDALAAATFGKLPSVRRSRSYRSIFFTYRSGLQFNPDLYHRSLEREAAARAAVGARGYIAQGPAARLNPSAPGALGGFEVFGASERALREAIRRCGDHGVPVWLAVGPLWDARAAASPGFIDALERWLERVASDYPHAGMLYRGVPRAPAGAIGDTPEHLDAAGREHFTRWLAPVLRARLGRPPGASPPAPPADPWQ